MRIEAQGQVYEVGAALAFSEKRIKVSSIREVIVKGSMLGKLRRYSISCKKRPGRGGACL